MDIDEAMTRLKADGIRKHQNCSKKEAEAKAIELMQMCIRDRLGINSTDKEICC